MLLNFTRCQSKANKACSCNCITEISFHYFVFTQYISPSLYSSKGIPNTGLGSTGLPSTGLPSTGLGSTGLPPTGLPVISALLPHQGRLCGLLLPRCLHHQSPQLQSGPSSSSSPSSSQSSSSGSQSSPGSVGVGLGGRVEDLDGMVTRVDEVGVGTGLLVGRGGVGLDDGVGVGVGRLLDDGRGGVGLEEDVGGVGRLVEDGRGGVGIEDLEGIGGLDDGEGGAGLEDLEGIGGLEEGKGGAGLEDLEGIGGLDDGNGGIDLEDGLGGVGLDEGKGTIDLDEGMGKGGFGLEDGAGGVGLEEGHGSLVELNPGIESVGIGTPVGLTETEGNENGGFGVTDGRTEGIETLSDGTGNERLGLLEEDPGTGSVIDGRGTGVKDMFVGNGIVVGIDIVMKGGTDTTTEVEVFTKGVDTRELTTGGIEKPIEADGDGTVGTDTFTEGRGKDLDALGTGRKAEDGSTIVTEMLGTGMIEGRGKPPVGSGIPDGKEGRTERPIDAGGVETTGTLRLGNPVPTGTPKEKLIAPDGLRKGRLTDGRGIPEGRTQLVFCAWAAPRSPKARIEASNNIFCRPFTSRSN